MPKSSDAVVEPLKKRYGHNLGMTKADRPALANRLPRERGAIVAYPPDPRTPFEKALEFLGPRVQNKRVYYTLDGHPCNATVIMEEAHRLMALLEQIFAAAKYEKCHKIGWK